MSKIADIRALSADDLSSKAAEARREIFNLRLQQTTGALEKPSRLNDLRKDIAKIETILSEKRLGLKVTSRVPQNNKKTKKK